MVLYSTSEFEFILLFRLIESISLPCAFSIHSSQASCCQTVKAISHLCDAYPYLSFFVNLHILAVWIDRSIAFLIEYVHELSDDAGRADSAVFGHSLFV